MTKRILFLTPQLPYPPHQGTTIRNYGLIDGLAARGHDLALVSFLEPGQPDPAETPLATICDPLITVPVPGRTRAGRLRDLAAGHADMARRLWSPDFLAAVQRVLNAGRFDAIHFEGIELMSYLAPLLPRLRRDMPDALLIYDAHNAEHALQARIARQDWRTARRWPLALYSSIQAGRLGRFEGAAVRNADHVLACSEADAAQLAALGAQTPITVIPNAIQMAAYDASQPSADLPHPALVFTGKMDFRPNVDAVLWFAGEILPRIRAEVPGAHFAVVGQKPHARLGALAGHPGVTVTGRVPAIQPYLQAADVYVAPLRMGSGTRLKLLEAMAMGRAIVSTSLGAEGLNAEPGTHLLLGDTPETFAEAVVSLLRDETRRAEMGARAAVFVRQRYDWAAIIPRLEAVYETATLPAE